MGAVTSQEYQEHLVSLADDLGCRLNLGDYAGMMFVEFGYVQAPSFGEVLPLNGAKYPSEQARYIVGLHELGHFAHGHTQGRPPRFNRYNPGKYHPICEKVGTQFYFDNGVLKSEAQAWEWALDNSKDDELAPEVRAFMWDTCLGSYYAGSKIPGHDTLQNGNRHWVKFKWDKPDEYFWSIKERIAGE